MAVYNTELSASQVSAIYNSAGMVPEPGTWLLVLLGALLLPARQLFRRHRNLFVR